MTVPLWDWQFIVVTAVAVGAVVVLARQFLPARGSKSGGSGAGAITLSKPGCSHCASNADAKPAATPSRTVMTQVVSMRDLRDTARQTKH